MKKAAGFFMLLTALSCVSAHAEEPDYYAQTQDRRQRGLDENMGGEGMGMERADMGMERGGMSGGRGMDMGRGMMDMKMKSGGMNGPSSMAAMMDGSVVVLSGNKLVKYDSDLNIVKEVEVGGAPKRKGRAEMGPPPEEPVGYPDPYGGELPEPPSGQ